MFPALLRSCAASSYDEEAFLSVKPTAQQCRGSHLISQPCVCFPLSGSAQLDIIMRVREQRVTLNREKFEARSGVPASFSEFQLQQYLKASALRWVHLWPVMSFESVTDLLPLGT